MDPNSLAEELPALYRAILDRVAVLEADGRRPEAARMRAEATRIYSRAWDRRARHRLASLLERSGRPSGGHHVKSPRYARLRGRRTRQESVVIS